MFHNQADKFFSAQSPKMAELFLGHVCFSKMQRQHRVSQPLGVSTNYVVTCQQKMRGVLTVGRQPVGASQRVEGSFYILHLRDKETKKQKKNAMTRTETSKLANRGSRFRFYLCRRPEGARRRPACGCCGSCRGSAAAPWRCEWTRGSFPAPSGAKREKT